MALNKNRKPKTDTAEFDDFVAQGGTVTDESPTHSKRKPSAKADKGDALPAWMARAATDKKTEAQPFRYNKDQHRLLEHAKRAEGRDYSKILADIVWPALEEKYGAEVPFD